MLCCGQLLFLERKTRKSNTVLPEGTEIEPEMSLSLVREFVMGYFLFYVFVYPTPVLATFCLSSSFFSIGIFTFFITFIFLPILLNYSWNCLHVCLPSCLSICLCVCLSVCLSAYLSMCLSVCLPVCLSVCLPVCLSVCMSVYLSICLSACLSMCLPACLSVCLPVCLSICLSICLSVYLSVCFF